MIRLATLRHSHQCFIEILRIVLMALESAVLFRRQRVSRRTTFRSVRVDQSQSKPVRGVQAKRMPSGSLCIDVLAG